MVGGCGANIFVSTARANYSLTLLCRTRENTQEKLAMKILVSVTTVEEAQLALDSGVDLIDLKDTSHGALASLSLNESIPILKVIQSKQLPNMLISATIGDEYHDLPSLVNTCEDKLAIGVDVIKIPAIVLDDEKTHEAVSVLSQHAKVVIVFPPQSLQNNQQIFCEQLNLCQRLAIAGVMLDTQDKQYSLWQNCEPRYVSDFIEQARHREFFVGLAGGLAIEDFDKLSDLAPDFAGFRSGLCMAGNRKEKLSKSLVQTLMARAR